MTSSAAPEVWAAHRVVVQVVVAERQAVEETAQVTRVTIVWVANHRLAVMALAEAGRAAGLVVELATGNVATTTAMNRAIRGRRTIPTAIRQNRKSPKIRSSCVTDR